MYYVMIMTGNQLLAPVIVADMFPPDIAIDERISVSQVAANSEGKAALLLSMVFGKPYGQASLHRLVGEASGGYTYIGGRTTQMDHCRRSFEGQGLVVRSLDENGYINFEVTKRAETLAKPIAAGMVLAGEKVDTPLQAVTNVNRGRSEDVSGTKLKIAAALIDRTEPTNIVNIVEQTGIGGVNIGLHAAGMALEGLMQFKTQDQTTGPSEYALKQDVELFPRIKTWRQQGLVEFLNITQADKTSNEAAKYLYEQRTAHGEGQKTLEQFEAYTRTLLNKLARSGRLTRIGRLPEAELSLDERQKEIWNEFLSVIVNSGRPAKRQEYLNDVEGLMSDKLRVAKMLQRGNRRSNWTHDDDSEPLETVVSNMLDDDEALTDRQILEKMAKQKRRNPHLHSITRILEKLRDESRANATDSTPRSHVRS